MELGAIIAGATALLGVIAKWFQRNGKTIIAAGGAAAAGAGIAAICKEKNFKKRVTQIEEDNAIKFSQEQSIEMEKLRKKYEENENELRKKVTEYLQSQGVDVSF